MNEEEFEAKLTPAAYAVVDDLSREYRRQLLENARKHSVNFAGETQEISVRDVLDGYEDIRSESLREKWSQTRTDSRIRALVWVALGIMAGLATNILASLLGNQVVAAALPVVAIVVALILETAVAPWIDRSRSLRSQERSMGAEDLQGLFLRKWIEYEVAVRAIAAQQTGESTANLPVRTLTDALRKRQVLDSSDIAQFENLLSLRNQILHKGTEVPREEYTEAIQLIDRLVAKLKKPT